MNLSKSTEKSEKSDIEERIEDLELEIKISNRNINKHNEEIKNMEEKINQILTPSEKKLCESFMDHATDNMKFNKRFARVIERRSLPIKNKALATNLHKYSYKTLDIKSIRGSNNRLASVVEKMDQNKPLDENEKIGLDALGKISKFTDNEEIMGLMRALDSPKVREVLELQKSTTPVYRKFIKKVQEKVPEVRHSGDLVMDVAEYEHKYKGRGPKNIKDRIKNWITPYSHAAIGLTELQQDGVKKSYRSHVYKDHIISEDNNEELFKSESFRVYPDMLIHSKLDRRAAAEALGIELDQLKPFLNKRYQEIAHEINAEVALSIHGEKPEGVKGPKLSNDYIKHQEAGFADFKPFGHRGKEKVTSWVERVSKGDNLGESLSQDADGKMICSEFAAKTTVVALHRLNKQLTEKMKKAGKEVPKKGILTMPFNKREDLSKIHPYRLIKQLQRRKAIEPIENSLVKSAVKR